MLNAEEALRTLQKATRKKRQFYQHEALAGWPCCSPLSAEGTTYGSQW